MSRREATLERVDWPRGENVDLGPPVLPTVDCNAIPPVPEGWKIHKHRKHGLITWDESRIAACWHAKQELGLAVNYKDFKRALKKKTILNANFLHFFLSYPGWIPADWRELSFGQSPRILFPDTSFESERKEIWICCLCLNEVDEWICGVEPCYGEWSRGALVAAVVK